VRNLSNETPLKEPISLSQRRAWDATWSWLLSPLDPDPSEDTAPAPQSIRPPAPVTDLDRERRQRRTPKRTSA
jgi:hypothetical protein